MTVPTISMISHKIRGFESIEIYPLADMHIGSRELNEAALKRTINEILDKPYRYVVLAGDLIDNGVKSSVTSGYDAMMQPAEQRRYAAELIAPLKDRILCMISGNHEYRSRKDTDTDPIELIASKLDIEHLYRPDIAFIKLDLGDRTNHRERSPKYCIAVAHGTGGGVTLGAGLSKTEPFGLAMGVDLLITGHSHKPATAPTLRLECDMQKGVMVPREIRIMVATGWLDYGGYPTRKLYKPVAIRPNKAILSAVEHDIAVLS